MACALIMAGGCGQRLWPLSTKTHPKQLLSLFSEKSMIWETVERIKEVIPYERIFIGTNAVQAGSIVEQLPMLPQENIIIEPIFKDTAAAIGYGSLYISNRYPHTQLVVLPSDHLIKDGDTFCEVLRKGIAEAKLNNTIVTLGIQPSRAETSFGYIEVGLETEVNKVWKTKCFCEKPDQVTANNYMKSGRHLWNSGMYIFNLDDIMKEIARYMPNHFAILSTIKQYIDKDLTGIVLAEATQYLFEHFDRISIDYGIMEQVKNLRVIPCDIGWNDVGSFNAFEEVFDKNDNGSIICKASVKEINAYNNIVYLEEDEVALIGVEDLVVVKSEGKLLICHKSAIQDIKKIFQ